MVHPSSDMAISWIVLVFLFSSSLCWTEKSNFLVISTHWSYLNHLEQFEIKHTLRELGTKIRLLGYPRKSSTPGLHPPLPKIRVRWESLVLKGFGKQCVFPCFAFQSLCFKANALVAALAHVWRVALSLPGSVRPQLPRLRPVLVRAPQQGRGAPLPAAVRGLLGSRQTAAPPAGPRGPRQSRLQRRRAGFALSLLWPEGGERQVAVRGGTASPPLLTLKSFPCWEKGSESRQNSSVRILLLALGWKCWHWGE